MRRDLQRSIVIRLNLAILQELMVHSTKVHTYGLSTNNKKNGFLRLIVLTIVKITSTDKEIMEFSRFSHREKVLSTLYLELLIILVFWLF
jgi:hypothetical protein